MSRLYAWKQCGDLHAQLNGADSEPTLDVLRGCAAELKRQIGLWRRPLRIRSRRPVPRMVFAIGMHKTGTTAIHDAFQMLGYRVFQLRLEGTHPVKACFVDGAFPHASEAVMFNASSRRSLTQCLTRHGIFKQGSHGSLVAFQDTPFYGLVEELGRAFPSAKFVYMQRDLDKWWRSAYHHFVDPTVVRFSSRQYVVRRDGKWARGDILNAFHGSMYGSMHGRPSSEAARLVWSSAFVQQAALVQRLFGHLSDDERNERLLVMDLFAGDGFAELAPFLGRWDATTWTFPHSNSKADSCRWGERSGIACGTRVGPKQRLNTTVHGPVRLNTHARLNTRR